MSYMGRRLILALCAKSNRDGSEMRITKFKIWTLVVMTAACIYYGGARCFFPFPSAVRAAAAGCKLPFTVRPSLSPENVMRTKEITKERIPVQRKTKGKVYPSPYSSSSSSADTIKEGVGGNSHQWWFLTGRRFPVGRFLPLRPPLFLPLPALLELPLRNLASRVALGWHHPSYICSG